MNWSSFSAGAVIAMAIWAGLWITLPPQQPTWRQCAPAQDGWRLIGTAQHPDYTDCFYARNVAKGAVTKKKVSG